ncbi:MAG TPA: 6-phosphogluconolactonase [Candidatus Eisenbacteria bacterium]|nr:6-phosphogluconolactonase [Candidatus Eisenbacteria bacterium]
MRGRLHVAPDADSLARTAADEFQVYAWEAIRARGRFTAALAGGDTPRAAYAQIAATWRKWSDGPLDWARVHIFWGDERHVPPDDPRSNYRMARETLISHVPLPPENVHPIPAAHPDPRDAAARYSGALREFFELEPRGLPRFDLVLLGMGADGHTASLFPGSDALEEDGRLAVATRGPAGDEWRITLTLPVLNHAGSLVVLVSGAAKASTLRRVLEGPETAPSLPIQRLNPDSGSLVWIVDREAAPWIR